MSTPAVRPSGVVPDCRWRPKGSLRRTPRPAKDPVVQKSVLGRKAGLLAFVGYVAVGMVVTASAWSDPTRRWVGGQGTR